MIAAGKLHCTNFRYVTLFQQIRRSKDGGRFTPFQKFSQYNQFNKETTFCLLLVFMYINKFQKKMQLQEKMYKFVRVV